MGCGPSKDANVATGNTLKSKSLLKNNSNESNSTTPSSSSSSTATADTTNVTEDTNAVTEKVEEDISIEDMKAAADKEEEEGKGGEDVEAKDVAPSAPIVLEEEEEEGKFIAAGSPDRYFSSRKDEEAVEGVTASTGCFSPLPAGILDGENVEVATVANVKEVEADEVTLTLDGNGEEEGKTSGTYLPDLKETSLVVEEKAAEVEVMENKKDLMA